MTNDVRTQHTRRARWSWLSATVDRLLPQHLHPQAAIEQLHRARLVVGVEGFLLVSGLIYCVVLAASGSQICATILASSMMLSTSSLFLLRWTGSPIVAGNAMCVSLWLGLTAMALRLGGSSSVMLSWYAAIPVIALFTATRRSAKVWAGVTLSSMAAFLILDHTGWAFTNDLSRDAYNLLSTLAWTGTIVLMLGLAYMADTLNRRTLSELAATHRDLQHVMDATSRVSIIATDPSGVITLFNCGAENMLGYSAEEMIGKKTPLAFHDEREVEALSYSLTRSLGIPVRGFDVFVAEAKVDQPVTREWTYIRKDGRRMIVSLSCTAVKNDKEEIIGFLGVALDITDRKLAEEKSHRLAAVTEQAADGMAVANLDGIMLYANHAWASMHGYETADELVGQPLTIFHTEQQLRQDVTPFNEKVLEHGSHAGEIGHMRLDGSTFVTDMTVTVLRDEGSLPYALAACARDITEQKHAELELRQSEAYLRTLTEALPDYIFRLDHQGIIQSVNRFHDDDNVADTLGRPAEAYLTLEYRTPFRQALTRAMATGEVQTIEAMIEFPDGHHYLLCRLSPLPDTGATPSVVLIATDITGHKRIEQQLRTERDYSENIISGTPTIICGITADGTCSFVNPAGQRATGYRKNELVGRNWWTTLYPDKEQDQVARLFDVLEDGIARDYEMTLTRRGGDRRTIAWSALPRYDEADRPLETIWFGHDVTERKQAEQKLLESHAKIGHALHREKMVSMQLEAAMQQLEAAMRDAEAATKSKSEFLANMSHEIRTPMTAILGFADNLVDPKVSDAEKVHAVHTIRRNGEHLLQIINDILDISKIEAEKLRIERVRFSPVQLVAEVHSLMNVRATGQNLKFGIEFIGPIPETIESDPTRIRQILVNLINNAIKFTEIGGVRLVARFVHVDNQTPAIQFDVVDSGIGMTEDHVANLFQPFTQADTSTTRKFGGTGLGLTISKRLANLLGGDIVAMSQPGEGSTFRVTISIGSVDGIRMLDQPSVTEIADTRTTPDVPAVKDTLDCRILLVEDGPDNQRLIAHILKKAGAEVTVVENGKLAVEAATAPCPQSPNGRPFDVILMDMQMPVMDGYEATGLLREMAYGGPIIALTAHAMAGDRQKCLDAGCDDYATKPINRAELIKTIEHWRAQGSTYAETTAAHGATT